MFRKATQDCLKLLPSCVGIAEPAQLGAKRLKDTIISVRPPAKHSFQTHACALTCVRQPAAAYHLSLKAARAPASPQD
eukprot:6979161-Alexandrium_andersonii.AAC.1